MNRGKHVVALDAASDTLGSDEYILTEEFSEDAITASEADSDWWVQEAPATPVWRSYLAPGLALAAIVLWSVAFVWSKWSALLAAPGLEQVVSWIAAWSGPVLLVCVVWLLVMRTSTREAARFGDAARLLGTEADRLSSRLTSVNSELSLAREFIAAQGRDLESLGRVASERLSQNAETLQSLIQTNGDQVEAIGTVSAAALDNMEKLRGQLPVIANSARDVTNNIGNAGRTAHAQLQEMIAGFKRINEFGQASERQVDLLRQQVSETLSELSEQTAQLEALTERRFAEIARGGEQFRSSLDEHQAAALSAFAERIETLTQSSEALAVKLAESEETAVESLSGRLAQIETDIAERQDRQLEHVRAIETHGDAVVGQMAAFDERLGEISQHAQDAEQRLASSLNSLADRITENRTALAGADGEISALTDASVRLLELVQAGSQHSREILPAALTDAETRLVDVEARVGQLHGLVEAAAKLGDQLHGKIGQSHANLAEVSESIAALHGRFGEQSDGQAKALANLRQSLTEMEAQSANLSTRIESELAQAVERMLGDRGAALVDQIDQATARASELSREATIQLRDQLAKVDELAGNLERRVAHARERAEERVENDFARRVALITESLNSHAIDIARALDSEVSDIAWSAYLKGDRGIFTRRAVSLLESGEIKAITQAYENDDNFRGHVNRYIHDFEAMLRQVLSTRDGDSLGVTLLSSGMGKLYVALAQAIERLRR